MEIPRIILLQALVAYYSDAAKPPEKQTMTPEALKELHDALVSVGALEPEM